MAVRVAVSEMCSRFGDDRHVERELYPIGAAAHLVQPGIDIDSRIIHFRSTIEAGLHRQEMFEGQFGFLRGERDIPTRKET